MRVAYIIIFLLLVSAVYSQPQNDPREAIEFIEDLLDKDEPVAFKPSTDSSTDQVSVN